MGSNKVAAEKHSFFVCDIPLNESPAIERHLLVSMDCARMVYNACLGECLKRHNILCESEKYIKALKMSKAAQRHQNGQRRTAAFREANKEVGFSEYDLHTYAKQFGHSWLGEHLEVSRFKRLPPVRFMQSSSIHSAKRVSRDLKARDHSIVWKTKPIPAGMCGIRIGLYGRVLLFRQLSTQKKIR